MGSKSSKTDGNENKIIFDGLRGSGKTTLLYQLKHGKALPEQPFYDELHETVDIDGTELVNWDVTGRAAQRPFFALYYRLTNEIVYVIDSAADVETIDEALEDLNRYVLQEDYTKDKVVMVLANKKDLKEAVSLKKMEEKVKEITSQHSSKLGGRCVFVKDCSAVTREGLDEAFSMFVHVIKYRKNGKITPGFKTFSSLQDKIKEISEKAEAEAQVAEGKKSHGFNFMDKLSHIPAVKCIFFR